MILPKAKRGGGKKMRINGAARRVHIANVRVPGGANDIYLDEEQLELYNKDPDAYAGAHVGLSKVEYIEWVEIDGAALCSNRTKTGDLCRNATGRIQQRPADWKATHRKAQCSSHSKS
jgi:hypothetical protein